MSFFFYFSSTSDLELETRRKITIHPFTVPSLPSFITPLPALINTLVASSGRLPATARMGFTAATAVENCGRLGFASEKTHVQ